jgi:hypothetical protein
MPTIFIKTFIILISILICTLSSGSLPDPKKTPGDVYQSVLLDWVCNRETDTPQLYQRTIIAVFKSYGIPINSETYKTYRLDYLVPTELGGTNNIKNLWPIKNSDYYKKKAIERDLFRCACNGLISLKEAQAVLMKDWKSWKTDSLY